MPDYANVLVQVVAFFGVINRVPTTTPAHNVFCYSTVAHILTPSVNLVFGPNSGFKNKCSAQPCSGWIQASKLGPFGTLSGYVRRGQQGEVETIQPAPTNSKNILKSFHEVRYANFRPNAFATGKRISMEILVGVVLHAWCPVTLKRFVAFSKKTEMCKKNIYRLCNVERLEQDIKSPCGLEQNRRQNVFSRGSFAFLQGGFAFVRGAWHSKNWQKLHWSIVFHFSIRRVSSIVWGG